MSRSSFRLILKRTATVIGWLILWPCLMIAVAIAALIGSFGATGEDKVGLAMGIFGLLMVMICWLIIWQLGKKPTATSSRRMFGRRSEFSWRASRVTLQVYTALGITLLFVGGGLAFDQLINYQKEADQASVASTPIIPNLARNQRVDDALSKIGVSDAEIARFSTKQVDKFSQDVIEDQTGMYGSYVNPIDRQFLYGEMEIKAGLGQSEFLTTVAHEYMHHVWFAILDDDTKQKLESDLISYYGIDPAIRLRTASYTDNQNLHSTELLSFYCTESTDSYLSSYILNQCNKYIDRSQLAMQR